MKTKRVLLLMVLCAAVSMQCLSQSTIGRQKVDQYPVTAWNTLTYGLTWLPSDYDSTTTKYPLIIFLHGSGEGGEGVSGLNTLVSQGLPHIIANGFNPSAVNPSNNQSYKFIVVSPQSPAWSYGWGSIQHILPDVISRYRIDTSRIYVTGLSAGGAGTLSCVTNGAAAAKKFAAIVPICAAGTNTGSEADQLPLVGGTYGVKVYSLCGAQDSWLSFAQNYTNTINNAVPAPQVPALLTALPGVGHEPAAWNTIYDPQWRANPSSMNIYEWMLQYDRSGTAPLTASVTANAGPSQTITLPVSQVQLNGNAVATGGATVNGFRWSLASGPAGALIADSTSDTTLVTGLVAGNYTFRFIVTGSNNETDTAHVSIAVLAAQNLVPTSFAGSDTTLVLPTDSLLLKGIGTDADGTIAAYSWSKISGPTSFTISQPTQAQSMVKNLVAGSYAFQLRVTDDKGALDDDTIQVTVLNATNIPPLALAGTDTTIRLPLDSIRLNGLASDSDGSIIKVRWYQINGPSTAVFTDSTNIQTWAKQLAAGAYTFRLSVTDNSGATVNDTVQVTVQNAVNLAPVVRAGADTAITLPVNSIQFNGTATDADGRIDSVRWTRISGPVQHKFISPAELQTRVDSLVAGTYQFELMATDSLGAIGRDTVTILVQPAPAITNCNGTRIYMVPGNDGGKYITGDPSVSWRTPVNPGDTLVLRSQYAWNYFAMENYSGSAACPIVVINEGGQVWLTAGIETKSCRYIKVTGSGHAPTYYGFKVYKPGDDGNGVALSIIGKSKGIEIDRVDVYKKTYGVWAKQDPLCDVSFNYPNFTMDSIEIHHSRFRNIGQDCIYAGNTDPLGQRDTWCDGAVQHFIPMRLSNINIHHLIIDSCNRTGIQLSGADGGYNQIHNNLITRCGYEYNQQQGTGISIGGMTRNCHVYNNTIRNTFLYGILSFGVGTNYIENNIVDSTGWLDGVMNTGSNPCNILASPKQTIPFDSTRIILRNNKLGLNATNDGTNLALVVWGPQTWARNNVVCGNTKLNDTAAARVFVDPSIHYTRDCNASLPNMAPVVYAGPDKIINPPGDSVQLEGIVMDQDGTITNYQWTKISGPASILLSHSDEPITSVNGLVPGTYVFRLTATDDDSLSASDEVMVSVAPPNLAPSANAGPNQWLALPATTASLNGGGNDPDGTLSAYQWTILSGPSTALLVDAGNPLTQLTNLSEGTYTLMLTVTDNLGAQGRDTMIIYVNPAPPASNIPPVAVAGNDIVITLPNNYVQLSGSGTDADGTVVAYQWKRVSGPAGFIISNSTQPQTSITSLLEGVYQFEFSVTDNQGSMGRDTVTISVYPAVNVPPTAFAGADQVITVPTSMVTLTGTGNDVDGSIASFQWTRISGPSGASIASSNLAQTNVNGLVEGVYQFELLVIDNQGAMARDTMTLTVNPPGNMPPVANAGASQTITLPVNSVQLHGTGVDVDGTIVNYNWRRISGPVFFTLENAGAAQTSLTNMIQGTYQFEFRVTDNLGAQGRDTITIQVLGIQGNIPPVANAGNDQTISLPVNQVALNGSGTDADGSVVYYTWTKISGPAQFSIASTSQPQTTMSSLEEGIYAYELTVIDNMGAVGKDTVMITVLPDMRLVSTISLYPNPATTTVQVKVDAVTHRNETSIAVYDVRGVLVHQERFVRTQQIEVRTINVSQYQPGTYFVVVKADINRQVTMKFIKQ
jgi:predicted esterase